MIQPKPLCQCVSVFDTTQALVFLLVSVCGDTNQALVSVCQCVVAAQALVFLLVSVCQCIVTQPKPWCRCVSVL